MTTASVSEPSALSQLLEDLAKVPRLSVPDEHFTGLAPGTAIGRFIIEREIGRGGFGVVYAALDPELGRSVALKLLRPGVGLARRQVDWIRREAEAVARLSHPGIVTLFDVGRAPEGAFLVFELLQGETLASRLARGPLAAAEAVKIALAVAEAVAHAHQAKVLHRDLKPANVFLCANDAIKVLDFGVAHLFGRDTTSTGGTPGYMSPEQRESRAEDDRTDLYAFGILLRVMLQGLPESRRRTPAAAAPPEPAPLDPRLPAPLRRLVLDLTRTEPGERPVSIHEVLQRLNAIAAALRPWRPRLGPWLGGGLAVVAVVGLAWFLTRGREAAPGERLVVAVAPAENGSGEPALDHLADQILVGLGESRRLRVVTRERLEAAVRASEAPTDLRDPAALGRLAVQVGAAAIARPVIRRAGDQIELSLTCQESQGGQVLYRGQVTVGGLDAVPGAIDVLDLGLRRALHEREADLADFSRGVAALTTPSMTAFLHYAHGIDCLDRASETTARTGVERCGPMLRRAIEADPSFSLAHYQLAYLLGMADPASVEARGHLESALGSRGRLSRRDEAMALAWKDHLEGRDLAAVGRYTAILGDSPDDLRVLYLVGDLHFHGGRYRDAAPYLAKVVAVDPEAEWALDHLVDSYALAGMRDELAALLAQLAPSTTAEHVRARVHGYAWLGEHATAVALARREAGSSPGPVGRYLELGALTAAGRLAEAQALAEALAAEEPRSQVAYANRVVLAWSLGQARQAWRLASDPGPVAEVMRPVDLAFLKATLAAGEGDAARLRAETHKLVGAAPELAPVATVMLALVGTEEQVRSLGDAVLPGSTAAVEIEALSVWRGGDAPAAVAKLTALEQRAPWPSDAIAPSYLISEIALLSDPSEALAAAARFRAQWPRGFWRCWAFPRSLLVSALAAERLGDLPAAREHARRLRSLMARADEAFPLAREARQVESRLAAQSTAARPPAGR